MHAVEGPVGSETITLAQGGVGLTGTPVGGLRAASFAEDRFDGPIGSTRCAKGLYSPWCPVICQASALERSRPQTHYTRRPSGDRCPN
jgi:hypothetical protein